jgi:hypothetical protein
MECIRYNRRHACGVNDATEALWVSSAQNRFFTAICQNSQVSPKLSCHIQPLRMQIHYDRGSGALSEGQL